MSRCVQTLYWYCIYFNKYLFSRPPLWRSGLRLAVPPEILVSSPGFCRSRSQPWRPMGRCTIGPVSSGLGEGLASRNVLSHHALVTPVVGQVQCMLTWSLGVQCFLQYIGVAGFWVNWALCQEAVWLGWVGLCFGGCTALDLCLTQVRELRDETIL